MKKNTRLIYAQAIIEVDVTDRPDFDQDSARSYLESALELPAGGRIDTMAVVLLSDNPGPRESLIEEYYYRDFKVRIYQVNRAVRPTYRAYSYAPGGDGYQTPLPFSARLPDSDDKHHCGSIQDLKEATKVYVDKKIIWRARREAKKSEAT